MTEDNFEQPSEPVEAHEVDDIPQGAHGEAGAEEAPAPSWSPEDAEEARAFGWKSPEEWRGDKPDTYIDDPAQFLDRLSRSRPFRVMQDRLEEQAEAARKTQAVAQKALEAQRAQYEDRIRALQGQKMQAVESGDVKGYEAISKNIEALRQAAPEAAPQQAGPDPYIEQYMASEEGKWLEDPALKQTAAQIIDLAPHVQSMPAPQQVAYAKSELSKMFPDKFAAPAPKPTPRPRTSPVEAGSLAGGRGGDEFSKLPADAKEAFAKQKAQGFFEHLGDEKAAKAFYAKEYNNA